MSKPQNKIMKNISYSLDELKDLIEPGDFINKPNSNLWLQVYSVSLNYFTYDIDSTFYFNHKEVKISWIPKDLMDLAIGYGLSRVVMSKASKKQKKFSIGELL